MDLSQEHPQLSKGDGHEKEHKKKKKHKKKKHKLRALSPLEQSMDTVAPVGAGNDMELLALHLVFRGPTTVNVDAFCLIHPLLARLRTAHQPSARGSSDMTPSADQMILCRPARTQGFIHCRIAGSFAVVTQIPLCW